SRRASSRFPAPFPGARLTNRGKTDVSGGHLRSLYWWITTLGGVTPVRRGRLAEEAVGQAPPYRHILLRCPRDRKPHPWNPRGHRARRRGTRRPSSSGRPPDHGFAEVATGAFDGSGRPGRRTRAARPARSSPAPEARPAR